MIVGNWQQARQGFFEMMAFSIEGQDRIFNSWLHQRPELANARWQVVDCKLSITPTTDMPEFRYRIIKLNKNSLIVENDEKAIETYRRLD